MQQKMTPIVKYYFEIIHRNINFTGIIRTLDEITVSLYIKINLEYFILHVNQLNMDYIQQQQIIILLFD